MEYDNFEIEVGLGAGREYEVSARSRAGEARELMRFPYDKLALENRLKDLQIALLRSGGKRRRAASSEEQAVQNFGLDLFNALFVNEVRTRYDISQGLARQDDKGLRLILRIQEPELAALPWEFMYDSRKAEYVCLSRNTPIIRYPESPQLVQPLWVKPPLNILCLAVSPRDLDPLDMNRERDRLEEAVKHLSGLVKLTWLKGQTWQHLQAAMQTGPWHIFHFIGHGGFNERSGEGIISLADDTGKAFDLTATKLARLLDHRQLKLVLLNSCEGGRASDVDIFSSTASILIRSGIPAVLAMQYEITDTAAIEFSRSFYRAVAQGLPLEAAVVEARKAISIAVNNTVEWGTPVLYLRSSDGNLFNVSLRKEQVDSLYQEARTAVARNDWLSAIEKSRTVLEQDSGHELAQQTLRFAEEQQTNLHSHTAGLTPELLEDARSKVNKYVGNRRAVIIMSALALIVTAAALSSLWWRSKDATPPLTQDGKAVTQPPTPQPPPGMTYVVGGQFMMGRDEIDGGDEYERPAHKVTVAPFFIDINEVTNEQYAEFVKATNHPPPNTWKNRTYEPNQAHKPVTGVAWDDAVAFTDWRSKREGGLYRLPTEEEWEFAARGTDGRRYPWGDKWVFGLANAGGASNVLADAGTYKGQSPYGAYDMVGNAWEWTASSMKAYEGGRLPDEPASHKIVVRGGNYKSGQESATTTYRMGLLRKTDQSRYTTTGFRCVKNL